ncbi:MAG: YdbL family protein [Pseudomonadota bacterium]
MALHLPMTRRFLVVLPLILAALLLAPQAASAQSKLDAYRMSGAVAERHDGYVEVRDASAAPDAGGLVREVNAERRALYEKRARETDVPVEEVGKLFATKIVERAPPGTYFRQPDGSYIRK